MNAALPKTNSVTKDALLSAVLVAYYSHYTLALIPDDVWLHILMSIAKHVSSTPVFVEYYRQYLANKDNPDGFTTISLVLPDELLQRIKRNQATTEELQGVFGRFVAQVAELSRSDLFKTFDADFTTSTPMTLLVSRIVTAYVAKEYFAMHLTSKCGIRQVELGGTQQDWRRIIEKINAFRASRIRISNPSWSNASRWSSVLSTRSTECQRPTGKPFTRCASAVRVIRTSTTAGCWT